MKLAWRLSRDWVRLRDAILRDQEDAAILAARDDAKTSEERAFVESVIRARRRQVGQLDEP